MEIENAGWLDFGGYLCSSKIVLAKLTLTRPSGGFFVA